MQKKKCWRCCGFTVHVMVKMQDYSRRRREFGRLLRSLRNERGLTCAELADRISSNFSAVAAIERGVRQAGADVSQRFADVLELQGEDRRRFVLLGLKTTKRDFLPKEVQGLDPQIIHPILALLADRKVGPVDIINLQSNVPVNSSNPKVAQAISRLAIILKQRGHLLEAAVRQGTTPPVLDLVIELKDGSVLVVEIASVRST